MLTSVRASSPRSGAVMDPCGDFTASIREMKMIPESCPATRSSVFEVPRGLGALSRRTESRCRTRAQQEKPEHEGGGKEEPVGCRESHAEKAVISPRERDATTTRRSQSFTH